MLLLATASLPHVNNTISVSGIIILFLVVLMVLFNYSFLRAYKAETKRNRELTSALLDLLAKHADHIMYDKKK